MWKVKRMNTARIVVLTIAIVAGGVAAYLASGSDPTPVVDRTPKLETVDVLVAKNEIPMGHAVSAEDLQWQTWPAASASDNFLRKDKQPDATAQTVGSIARFPFIAGEPIREQKLVKGNGSGFMAAILPSGARAISTEISPETGAGGFILPNDRVDVILTRREQVANQADSISAEIILSNVRVLAIDQTVEDKGGQKVVVGKTATLELKPDQSEVLARARQTGTLTLALRSLVDAGATENREARRDSINIVRFGVSTPATIQK